MRVAFLFTAMFMTWQSAQAFITVIDVTDRNGETSTIQNPEEVAHSTLAGKKLSYRGKAEEAKALLEKIIKSSGSKFSQRVVEINKDTQTISILLTESDALADSIYQWVVLKGSN